MRKEGTIVRWDSVRGFGFIRCSDSAQDVFVHVRDCRSNGGVAPFVGLRVSYDEVHMAGKGPRATAVRMAGQTDGAGVREGAVDRTSRGTRRSPANQPRRARSSHTAWVLLVMAIYATGLAWLVWRRQAPWWILPASLFVNLATFFAYWQDKFAAEKRRWRTSEDALHFWSLAGGWGGAWFAQQVLRHKSAKESFRAAYWLTVTLHCAAAVAFAWFTRPSPA